MVYGTSYFLNETFV